jgi:nucleotide-binding universal stress UspA family protein
MKLRRILVPVDFSTHSVRALDYAAELGKPFKAELTVLYVIEPIYYTVPDFAGAGAALAGVLEEQRTGGREQLLRLERRYAKRRITLRGLLQTGAPHQAICDTARRLKVDLIVMATHGRTGLLHVLMGSVAERVVRVASCPVLTLRPAGAVRRRAVRRQR